MQLIIAWVECVSRGLYVICDFRLYVDHICNFWNVLTYISFSIYRVSEKCRGFDLIMFLTTIIWVGVWGMVPFDRQDLRPGMQVLNRHWEYGCGHSTTCEALTTETHSWCCCGSVHSTVTYFTLADTCVEQCGCRGNYNKWHCSTV